MLSMGTAVRALGLVVGFRSRRLNRCGAGDSLGSDAGRDDDARQCLEARRRDDVGQSSRRVGWGGCKRQGLERSRERIRLWPQSCRGCVTKRLVKGVGNGLAMDLSGSLHPVSGATREDVELRGTKGGAGLNQTLIDRARTPAHLVDDPGRWRRLGEFLDATRLGRRQRLGQGVPRGCELCERPLVEVVDCAFDVVGAATAGSRRPSNASLRRGTRWRRQG